MRLGLVKQSFFDLLGQYGRCVTKANFCVDMKPFGFASWAIDPQPARATGLIVKYYATFKICIILFVFPKKFCISIVFIFSWDHCTSQEKLKTMLMQTFGGQTKSIMAFLKVAYRLVLKSSKNPTPDL